MNFTNDHDWEITFMSLHENPPQEDVITMHWSQDIPPIDRMIEAIIVQRPELERFKHHISVQRYQRVDTRVQDSIYL